jgi:hypothetical protein
MGQVTLIPLRRRARHPGALVEVMSRGGFREQLFV